MNMPQKDYSSRTVGQIVADRFETARVFARHRIDFCCHGNVPFAEACRNRNVSPALVAEELDRLQSSPSASAPDFSGWPLDLLVDYVLKTHHRNIRSQGPELEALLDKVVTAHAERHPELRPVSRLFHEALLALESHLQKEEQVLFPYIYEMCRAQAEGERPASFHCGTIFYPIHVMEEEHSHEGARFEEIASLTADFTPPEDACPSYRLALQQLQQFKDALHEHIHLENNLIFPRALEMEQSGATAPNDKNT